MTPISSLGELLVPMIEALDERGPDAFGSAVYAEPPDGTDRAGDVPGRLRLSLGSDEEVDWTVVGCALLDRCGTGADFHPFGAGLVVDVLEDTLPEARAMLAAKWPQLRVLGTGTNMRVLKDTGRPADTCARYGIGRKAIWPSPTRGWRPSRP